MVCQPIGLSGQPSASAIGRHIMKPVGAYTMRGHVSLTTGALPCAFRRALACSTQLMSAGLQRAGCSSPATIFLTVGSGELSWIICTMMSWPAEVFTACLLKASVTMPSHSALVSLVTIEMPMALGGRGVGVGAGGAAAGALLWHEVQATGIATAHRIITTRTARRTLVLSARFSIADSSSRGRRLTRRSR